MRNTDILRNKEYDLLVIGGGINGAAMARLAAEKQLSVALVEKSDFAGGASSKSTKLIHGGIRYLENLEFDLVRQSLKERFIQLNSAPHLVKPIRFIIPAYDKETRPLWMVRLGAWLYDLLSGRFNIKKHRKLTREEVIAALPGIKQDGLLGGVEYWDAQMDDARLCLENVLSARLNGADVFNYMQATTFHKENGKTVAVTVKDLLTDESIKVKAKKVAVAAGPWTNDVFRRDNVRAQDKLRTTKGVHLVYRDQLSQQAVLLQNKKDKRVLFVIPWQGHSLIGTTDTDYKDHPDDVSANEKDVNYLLEAVQKIFSDTVINADKIISSFAGLRPLVNEPGNPSKVSRRHVIDESYSGVYYVMGGKYTTYRAVAQECLKKIFGVTFKQGYYDPLYGTGAVQESAVFMADEYGVDVEVVEHLSATYGTRYRDVLSLTSQESALKKRLREGLPLIWAQVRYALNHELAQKAEDVIDRRIGLAYQGCPVELREEIEQFCRQKKAVDV